MFHWFLLVRCVCACVCVDCAFLKVLLLICCCGVFMFCGDACSWRAGSKDLDQTRSDEKHSTRAPWSNDRSTSVLTGRAVRTIDYRWFLQDGALLVCPHNARRLLMLLLIWCGLVCSHVVVDAEEHWFLQDLLRFSLHWSNGQPNEGGPAPSRCNCKNSWLSSVLTARPVRTLAQQEFLQRAL